MEVSMAALSISAFTPAYPAAAVGHAGELPGVAIGERVVKPVLDYLWSGILKIDNVFSHIATFPPVASAEKTELQECLGTNLPVVYQITQKGVEVSDPNLLNAAHQLYGPFFQQCFEDETYNKLRNEHDKAQAHHEAQVKVLDGRLVKCEQDNQGKTCYKQVEISRRPALERVKIEGDSAAAREWKTVPGFLCWTINVNRPYWPDKMYDKGGYNCDLTTNKPTVKE